MSRWGDTAAPAAPAKKNRWGDEAYTTSPAAAELGKFFKATPEEAAAMVEEAKQKYDEQRTTGEFWAMPGWKRGLTTASDIVSAAGSGASFGLGEKAAALVRAPFTDKTYDEELAQQRKQTQDAKTRLNSITSGSGDVLEIAPAFLLPELRIAKGAGAIARGIGRAAEGAGYGGLSWLGGDDMSTESLAEDVGFGMGVGSVGGAAIDAAGAGFKKLGRLYQDYGKNPTEKAWAKVSHVFEDAGLTKEKVDEFVAKYGPEAMIADLLPKLPWKTRRASELNPEARKLADDRLTKRAEGGNERIASSAFEAVGLPADSLDKGARDELAQQFRDTMNRPVQREKWIADLSPEGQKLVNDRLEAEKIFNQTKATAAAPTKEDLAQLITSNLKHAVGGALAGGTLGYVTDYADPWTGGLAGFGVKGVKQAMPLVRATLARGGKTARAPTTADILTSPASEAQFTSPLLNDAVQRGRDFLASLATRLGTQQYGGPR